MIGAAKLKLNLTHIGENRVQVELEILEAVKISEVASSLKDLNLSKESILKWPIWMDLKSRLIS